MGDRMHCQTQDIVVAGLGKDLGDMPLDFLVFDSQTRRRISTSISDSSTPSGMMRCRARGNVEYPSMVERMIARSSPVPTFL
jgi:hypothetical protein